DVRVLQGVQNQVTNGNKIEYALISYIGRVNYDYDQKYLLSASIRRDGGSRFGPGNKIGYFPAFSAGWRISEEAFMQGLEAVSDFKIRASYEKQGTTGLAITLFKGPSTAISSTTLTEACKVLVLSLVWPTPN